MTPTMTVLLMIFAFITVGACQFWFVHRKRIYRATTLDRAELNRMHRHTLLTVLLCFVLVLGGPCVPAIRFTLLVTAVIMLVLVLPLRTLMIELGIRYRRGAFPEEPRGS